jgi:alkylation response protein AidB-like acyl-CoA dehydrogenase
MTEAALSVRDGQLDDRDITAARRAAVARARDLSPGLRARAARADTERRVPQQTIEELHDAGLFGILRPRALGGEELGIAALVEVTAELAAACGSTGWVYGVLAGHGWLLNLFPIEAQQEILADPRTLTGTVFRLNGCATRVDGGYRIVDGAGRFCSGIDHASWVIVGIAVTGEQGPPELRFFVVPRKDIEVVDDWFSVGMRGTGSRSIRIADAFVPEHRSVALDALSRGESPGAAVHRAPLYRTPFQLVAPFSIVGAPLGIARGAVDVYTQGLEPWLAGLTEIELAAKSTTFARVAQAAAEIDAAYSLIVADATRIDALTDPGALSPLDRARIPRDWAYAAQTARDAVARLFAAAGGSATYDESEMQRVWRDVNAAAQHYAFVWDNAMSDYGRVLLGLQPLNAIPGKRR